MVSEFHPFDIFKAGELIVAERFNNVQIEIKKYVSVEVGNVKKDLDDYKGKPIDAAKFGGKNPEEWTKLNDERYVQRSELKGGWGEYRRYFKQINRPTTDPDPALLEHNLRRYPTVTLFELTQLITTDDDAKKLLSDDTSKDARFVVYYAGRRDPIAEKFMTRSSDDTFWGDNIELILEQFNFTPTPTQLFDDVLNDLWGKMFDPGLDQDNFRRDAYGHSRYIQTELLGRGRTVQELKAGGIWDDLRVAIRPQMIPANIDFSTGVPDAQGVTPTNHVDVFHLSQNVVEVKATKAIDLMILLRT
jgi:hypothetical protein